jgi:hypothetical protein
MWNLPQMAGARVHNTRKDNAQKMRILGQCALMALSRWRIYCALLGLRLNGAILTALLMRILG